MPFNDVEKQNQHYRDLYARSEKRREAVKSSHARRVERARHATAAYKLFFGCCDCGYRVHAAALDFDHREPSLKRKGIAEMIRSSASLADIFEEAFKCDVRCSNCHRIRHFEEVQKQL